MQKSLILKHKKGFFLLTYMGQKCLLGLILVPCDLESLCLAAVNHPGGLDAPVWKRELHRDKQLFLTQNHLASTLIPVK